MRRILPLALCTLVCSAAARAQVQARGSVRVVEGAADGAPVRARDDFGRFRGIDEAADLSDEQVRQIKKFVGDARKQVRAWHDSKAGKAYQTASREYWKAYKAARSKPNDKKLQAAVKQARAKKAKARESYLAIVDAEETLVLKTLEPKQRLAWERHSLADRMNRLLKPLELDEAQQKELEKLYDARALRYVDIAEDFTERRRAIDDRTIAAIKKDLLTADQRKTFDAEYARDEKDESPGPVQNRKVLKTGNGKITITVTGGAIEVKNIKIRKAESKTEDDEE